LAPIVVVLTLTAVGGTSAVAQANGTNRPWKASGSGVSTFTPGTPNTISADGDGKAAHLGKSTFHNDIVCSTQDCLNGTSSITIVAANGDIVTATGVIVNGVNNATITGGTGRFAGASGSFTVTTSNVAGVPGNPFQRTFDFEQSGAISY
jgi:hypothetical protein